MSRALTFQEDDYYDIPDILANCFIDSQFQEHIAYSLALPMLTQMPDDVEWADEQRKDTSL